MTTATSNTTADKTHEAVLSSGEGFTAFSFGGYHIRFRAPYSLERYVNIVSRDDGYLVVMAKYMESKLQENVEISQSQYSFARNQMVCIGSTIGDSLFKLKRMVSLIAIR